MKTILCMLPGVLGFSMVAAQPLFTGSYVPLSAGVYSTGFRTPFDFLSNTASLADGETSAGLYASNRYMLKELAAYTAAATLPVAAGGIGLAMHYTGTSTNYNELQWALAYGKSLGRVQVGAGVGYTIIRIPGYVSSGAVSYSIGTVWRLTRAFHSGLQVSNLFSRRSDQPEKQPVAWSVGAGYAWSEKLLLSGIITKEEFKPVQAQVTLQYVIQDCFVAGVGMMMETASPWLSLGWQWKNWQALVTAAFHPQLGATPGLAVVFRGERGKEK
mgnify:CR=1 FL=1